MQNPIQTFRQTSIVFEKPDTLFIKHEHPFVDVGK